MKEKGDKGGRTNDQNLYAGRIKSDKEAAYFLGGRGKKRPGNRIRRNWD